jgi:hypothetical protein
VATVDPAANAQDVIARAQQAMADARRAARLRVA